MVVSERIKHLIDETIRYMLIAIGIAAIVFDVYVMTLLYLL